VIVAYDENTNLVVLSYCFGEIKSNWERE